jgi:hypothetical protein
MTFHIGDEVRLLRGWTRMIIIGFRNNGDILAKYDRGEPGDWSKVCLADYKYPEANHSYARPKSGFVRWDRGPKGAYTMPIQTYRLIENPAIKGELRGRTAKGDLLLETPDGQIYTMSPKYVELDIPFTFSVKATGNKGYNCDYILPDYATVAVGQMLHSNGGHTYIVTRVDTKCQHPKGVFKGVRLLTEQL